MSGANVAFIKPLLQEGHLHSACCWRKVLTPLVLLFSFGFVVFLCSRDGGEQRVAEQEATISMLSQTKHLMGGSQHMQQVWGGHHVPPVQPARSWRSVHPWGAWHFVRTNGRQALQRSSAAAVSPAEVAPAVAPSGLPNRFWEWRGQTIRYQVAGEENVGAPAVVLVHGLFVNADHWRNNVKALADDHGFRVYAVDLLGNGYSSKPPPCSVEARKISGEVGRDLTPPVADLGTAAGGQRKDIPVCLEHPLGSVYNFFTWAEQLTDFSQEIVKADKVTLVCNSIGTISGLQAALDKPELFDSVLVVNPNFRELHVAETPQFVHPFIRSFQRLLRERGQGLFDALAKPGTVKQILLEPYHDPTTVTDELVDRLLTPLLTQGSADVVFDTLSYSAGPLPEQQLGDPKFKARVWVCWGERDPWTPAARVLALADLPPVERVLPLSDVGHCPHDEAPCIVNALVAEFVKDTAGKRKAT